MKAKTPSKSLELFQVKLTAEFDESIVTLLDDKGYVVLVLNKKEFSELKKHSYMEKISGNKYEFYTNVKDLLKAGAVRSEIPYEN